MFPSKEIVERVRKEYPAGVRVELLRMDDPQAPPVGTLGTVIGVDDAANILVKWDNGSGFTSEQTDTLPRASETLPTSWQATKASLPMHLPLTEAE